MAEEGGACDRAAPINCWGLVLAAGHPPLVIRRWSSLLALHRPLHSRFAALPMIGATRNLGELGCCFPPLSAAGLFLMRGHGRQHHPHEGNGWLCQCAVAQSAAARHASPRADTPMRRRAEAHLASKGQGRPRQTKTDQQTRRAAGGGVPARSLLSWRLSWRSRGAEHPPQFFPASP